VVLRKSPNAVAFQTQCEEGQVKKSSQKKKNLHWVKHFLRVFLVSLTCSLSTDNRPKKRYELLTNQQG